MLALPTMSSGAQKGGSMLIGDPLGEGNNASSTDREFRCPEGSGKLIDDPLW